MQLSGAALSTQIVLSGEESGALEVKTFAPIEFGAFSLSQNKQSLLDNVTLRINPRIRFESAQSIRFDLDTFQLLIVMATLSAAARVARRVRAITPHHSLVSKQNSDSK
jgi:hypothetical protein